MPKVVGVITKGATFPTIVASSDLTAASETAAGVAELATPGEINAGTDATRAMSPDAFAASEPGTLYLEFRLFSAGVSCTTGDSAFFMQVPPKLDGMDLVYVHARNNAPGTTGTMDIQIRRSRETNPTTLAHVDMLSTVITIDTGEYGSHNAAAAPVIKSDGSEAVAENDVVSGDIDAIHSTAALGCIVTVGFRTV